MLKVLVITMPDGNYEIPVQPIAEARAAYYANVDVKAGDGAFDELYAKELAYTLSANDEMLDWAANNTNWADVKAIARKLPPKPVTVTEREMERAWTNAEMEVIERSVGADNPSQ
jgi:hypothetical protein